MRIRQLKFLGIVFVATFTLIGSVVYAQFGACVPSSIGQAVCAPPSGSIASDSIGQIVCGPGQCMKNNIGQVVCVGGCIQASSSYCVLPSN